MNRQIATPSSRTFRSAGYGKVSAKAMKYQDGNVAVVILDVYGHCVCKLSVNLPEDAHLLNSGNEFFAKTWAENEAMSADALASGLFRDTGRRVRTGYVEAQVWEMLF